MSYEAGEAAEYDRKRPRGRNAIRPVQIYRVRKRKDPITERGKTPVSRSETAKLRLTK